MWQWGGDEKRAKVYYKATKFWEAAERWTLMKLFLTPLQFFDEKKELKQTKK